MRPFNTMMPKVLHDRLEAQARTENTPIAKLVRRLLTEGLARIANQSFSEGKKK